MVSSCLMLCQVILMPHGWRPNVLWHGLLTSGGDNKPGICLLVMAIAILPNFIINCVGMLESEDVIDFVMRNFTFLSDCNEPF